MPSREPITRDWFFANVSTRTVLDGAGIEALTEDPHPDDELVPDELWWRAGLDHSIYGRDDDAERCWRRSMELAAPREELALGDLVVHLVESERVDEGVALLPRLRRNRTRTIITHILVGGALAEAGRQTEAHTWLTAGLDMPGEEQDAKELLVDRYRLRRDMGEPHDEFDEVAEDLLDEDPDRFP